MHSDYRPGIETRPTAYAMSLASEVGCDGEWEDDEIKETLSCLQSKPFGKFESQRTNMLIRILICMALLPIVT